MMARILFIWAALLCSLPFYSVSSETIALKEEHPVPDALPFGEELAAEDIVTWYELEKIAAAENRIVLSDCNAAGLQDHIARWIPTDGLNINLKPKSSRRVFLYLDFVGMVDQGLEAVADEQRCRAGRRETVFSESRGGPYEWVEVYVNGERKGIFYQGHDAGFTGPIALPIARDEFQGGVVHVRIVPSGRLMALWDVFLSHAPPEE